MASTGHIELEVKLSLDPEHLALAEQILRARPDCEAGGQIELRNIYFDTPDFALNWQRMALRVRQKGSRFIQTLKTQGEFIDGGHRRMEWEWPLATAELDLSLLAATPLSGQADLNQLQPAFETNFERQVLMITEFGSGGDALAGGDALVGWRSIRAESWVVAVPALCAKSNSNSSLGTQRYCGSWRWSSPRWYPFF